MKNLRRQDLVEAGRRLWTRGLISGTEGNLSVRIRANRILATVSGVSKGFLRDEDVIEMDLEGRVIGDPRRRPSSEIKMHLAAYRIRDDVLAVCHAHPPHATAFATAGLGMTACVVPEIIVALGAVPLAPYATPSTDEVPQSVEKHIGSADAVLLENHGAITVGKDIFDALHKMESVDHAARIMILSRSLGGPRTLAVDDVEKLRATRDALGFRNPAPRCE